MKPKLLDGATEGTMATNGADAPPDASPEPDADGCDDGGLWHPDDPGFVEEMRRRMDEYERGETTFVNGPELMERLRARFG